MLPTPRTLPPEADGSYTLTASTIGIYQSSPHQSSKSRKKVTTACEGCKQRKVKCDGNQPCARCTARLLLCSYSASEDRRVRSAEKRRIKQLEEDNQQLRDLIANAHSSQSDLSRNPQSQTRTNYEKLDDITTCTSPQQPYSETVSPENYDLNQGSDHQRLQPTITLEKRQALQWSGGFETRTLTPGSTRSFGNLPFSSAITANHYPDPDQQLQLQNFCLPDWQILPQWSNDDSPLGRAYTDFHTFGRRNPAAATPDRPHDLVDATLLFRQRRNGEIFDADGWASELQNSFVEPITRTVSIAGAYVLARLMRWLLRPSPATYAAVPDMIKPSMFQRMRVHSAFIDTIAMPSLRHALITNSRNVLDAIIKAGLDVSWPYSVNEALVHLRPKEYSTKEPPENERVYISPQFAVHVADPKNWIFGRSILSDFPELINVECSISQEDVIRPRDRWL